MLKKVALYWLICFCTLPIASSAQDTFLPLVINAEMLTGLYSERSEIGDKVEVKVTEAINLPAERIFIPIDSIIEGKVTEVEEAGRGLKKGKVQVLFGKIIYPNGYFLETEATLVNSATAPKDEPPAKIKGKSSWTQNLLRLGKVGTAALIGGPIGATVAVGTLVFDKGGKVRINPGDRAYVRILSVSIVRHYGLEGKLAEPESSSEENIENTP